MARYLSLARAARFNLGPRVLGWVDWNVLGREEQGVVRDWQERERAKERAQTPRIDVQF